MPLLGVYLRRIFSNSPLRSLQLDFRNNQSLEMMRELDDLKSFKMQLDFQFPTSDSRTKKNEEKGRAKPPPKERKVIKAIKIETEPEPEKKEGHPTSEVEKRADKPITPISVGGEYLDDFDDVEDR